ncbi:alpha-glucosidase/alpha-galactosidase, partial [Escherichia coli]|nr:alpha-glucosidase/alpha-galactosidase [Escherichia coli]
GVHRARVERLPKRIVNYVLRPRMMRMEWALEAFLEGGRDILFEWIIVDTRTKSTEQVNQAIDALLSIPANQEMKKHFR